MTSITIVVGGRLYPPLKIPSKNILWAGSRSTIEGIDFRIGWDKFFDPVLRNQETKGIAENAIEYFKNLGFEEVHIR